MERSVSTILRNQQVVGSSPIPGSSFFNCQSSDYFLLPSAYVINEYGYFILS